MTSELNEKLSIVGLAIGIVIGIILTVALPMYFSTGLLENSNWNKQRTALVQDQERLKSFPMIPVTEFSEKSQPFVIEGNLSMALKANGTSALNGVFSMNREDTDWLMHDFQLARPFDDKAKSKFITKDGYMPANIEDVPLDNVYIIEPESKAVEILHKLNGTYFETTSDPYYHDRYRINDYIEGKLINAPYVIGTENGSRMIIENPSLYLNYLLQRGFIVINGSEIYARESQKDYRIESLAFTGSGSVYSHGLFSRTSTLNFNGVVDLTGNYYYGGPLVKLLLRRG